MRYLPDRCVADVVTPVVEMPALVSEGQSGVGSMLRLCASVFSWMFGGRAAKLCGDVYQLQACLLLYAQAGSRELDARPNTRAPTLLRERGLSRADVRELWRNSRAEYGYLAALDMELLVMIYPTAVWRALAGLVGDGPGECSQRIDKVLHRVALRPAAVHAGGREGARVSRKTLNNYAWPLSWTMRTLAPSVQ